MMSAIAKHKERYQTLTTDDSGTTMTLYVFPFAAVLLNSFAFSIAA